MPNVLTVTPREPGFQQYARDLTAAGNLPPAIDFPPLRTKAQTKSLAQEIAARNPDLIHIHHEFGFLGSKTPGRYRFPKLVQELRKRTPKSKIVATAHTVLGPDYEYPWQGRGLQAPLRLAANVLLLPHLKKLWIQKTWGPLDGVIVHSSLQQDAVRSSGCPLVEEIPHYIPEEEHPGTALPRTLKPPPKDVPVLLVFGYFTPEKAQDVAIRAMARLNRPAHLILAGGVRRDEDQRYFRQCESLISELGLGEKIQITGFVTFDELDALVRLASLVLLPFRETSGSGSLADLLSRHVPILASDLPLNLEIEKRARGALHFFRSENPDDCAAQTEFLLAEPGALDGLRRGAREYAERFSARRMAERHAEFYQRVVGSAR
jgi:glycosyltransferase involved in cell wall biosynthesis